MRKHIQRIQSSFLLFVTLFALAACGGGGGTAPTNNGGGGSGGGDTDDGDDGSVSETYSIEVGLYDTDVDLDDLENSTEVSSISSFGSAFFVARVTDTATSDPVAGAIVSMSTSAGGVSPSQVLTNSNGVAATRVTADDASLSGAATLTAAFSEVSQSQNFSFGSVDLQLGRDANDFADTDDIDFVDGEIDISASGNLSAGGTTVLRVVVVSNDNQTEAFTSPLTIEFTSDCAAAEIDTDVTTANGIAVSTFRANSCEGDVNITANVAELTGVSATGEVFIESADVGSINFVSSDPTQITLKGTGNDTSVVTFRVLTELGDPAVGETVTGVLSSTIGGITIGGSPSGTATTNTNGVGEASFNIQAGTVPTSVRIEASVNVSGTEISTISGALAVTTGQPDNESFSLSASILNPGGFDFDGFNSELTVRAADSNNNPVPDGTTVIFTTEYGAVVGSCDTAEGACTATWTSQDERLPLFASTGRVLRISQIACDSDFDGTADLDSGGGAIGTGNPCPTVLTDPADIDFPGQIYGGRTTILAYATGEESFVDSNGNGLYDVGEPFVDLPEAFIDKNEDGVFGGAGTSGACTGVGTGNAIVPVVDVNDIDEDGNTTEMVGEAELCADWQEGGAEEEFIDFNTNSDYDRGNGIYNGSLCQAADEANGDCTTVLVSVRDQVVLNVGGSTPYIEIYESSGTQILDDPSVAPADLPVTRVFRISDVFNGPLPSGTTFNVQATNCEIGGPTSYTTPDSNSIGSQAFAVALAADDTPSTGLVTLTVSVPDSAGGVVATSSFSCTD